jgi:glucoamylase
VKRFGIAAAIVCLAASLGIARSPSVDLEALVRVARERLFLNIHPPGTAPGIVIASPSRQDPDYRYHWTRDASLVMGEVVSQFSELQGPKREELRDLIADFAALSYRQQQTTSAEGLGEPRYRVDGTADTIPWARPQFDGPALRALALLRFVRAERDDGPARKLAVEVLRRDLEFVSEVWRWRGYDLWEELQGLHFYTHAVQYAALKEGAEYFAGRGDTEFAARLAHEAGEVQADLEKYWDPARGYLGASRELEPRPDQPHYKDANLDAAVILAVLHAKEPQGILVVSNERVLATARALERAFADEYRLNRGARDGQAVAIGRFTDDVYFGGNPWYLTTAAFAELHYRLVTALLAEGRIELTELNLGFFRAAFDPAEAAYLKAGQVFAAESAAGERILSVLRLKGDAYFRIVQRYAADQGALSEQFDRDAGVPVSARDLTWSYAAVLSAARARGEAYSMH